MQSPSKQVVDYTQVTGLKFPQSTMVWLLVAAFFALPFIAVAVTAMIAVEAVVAWLVFAGMAILFVVFAVRWYKKDLLQKREFEDKMGQFAVANGFTYLAGSGVATGPGTLFGVGHSTVSRGSFAGTIHGLPFSLYSYQYDTGSGKNRTTHDAMVMEIILPRVLPQFVIDSEIENVLPISFDKSQKIELEGDFHKYFDFYAPDTYGVTALTLLAPDVMEVLLERAALCDIEIVQNRLYFYWPVPVQSGEQLQEVFETTLAVIKKLGSKLTTDDIYATKSQAAINAMPNAQGIRLKRSGIGILTVAVITGYIIAELFNGFFGSIGGFFVFAFWAGIIGYAIFTAVKQGRLKREYLQRYRRKHIS